jgi:hypothetical protein
LRVIAEQADTFGSLMTGTGNVTVELANITTSGLDFSTIAATNTVKVEFGTAGTLNPGTVMTGVDQVVLAAGTTTLTGEQANAISFSGSGEAVVITAFTTGPGSTTLPLLIWSKVKLGVTPDINALATLMVVTVGLGVIAAGIIMNRAEKRRQAEERLAFQRND